MGLIAAAGVPVRAQPRVLIENLMRPGKVEAIEAHARGNLAEDAPVGTGLAGRGQESTLARDPALRAGDRAALLAPAQRR